MKKRFRSFCISFVCEKTPTNLEGHTFVDREYTVNNLLKFQDPLRPSPDKRGSSVLGSSVLKEKRPHNFTGQILADPSKYLFFYGKKDKNQPSATHKDGVGQLFNLVLSGQFVTLVNIHAQKFDNRRLLVE